MQGMFERLVAARLHELARRFPAVAILGPRQVGKTTAARAAFPRHAYVDLEDPATRLSFSEDPRFHVDARARPDLIIDEAQAVPDVFAALRGAIDANRRARGRFIILGSAQPTLVRQVSETLAGRIGIVELDPLVAAEVAEGEPARTWDELWLAGGFPDALLAEGAAPGGFRDWWEAYLRTYIERDLGALGVRIEPLLMRRMMTMLAHGQGGLTNSTQLGASLGVTFGTVQRYLDILEQTFLLRRLPPYFANIGKRLVKSPRLYLRDTGLVHHLLGIGSHATLDSHPIRGMSWETFVIEDLIRRERLAHPHSQAFFWRTAAGAEADLVIERDGARFVIEIKTARASSPHLARGLRAIADDLGARSITVVDQAPGVEMIAPSVERRGFAEAMRWLPG